MVTSVMQSLGCDVSAINTVHYSMCPRLLPLSKAANKFTGNHTAYKQVKGTKTSPDQILDLYEGLRQSNLNNFDVLLTGYMPSAHCVQAIGKIGRDIKFNAGTKPGSFFWGESALLQRHAHVVRFRGRTSVIVRCWPILRVHSEVALRHERDCLGFGLADIHQCSIRSWATMGSSTSRKMKYRSTRRYLGKRISFCPTSSKQSRYSVI